ncbi:hypothetical protein [Sphingobacterium detergens]|uniref:hypothetical protein n=1 Tax=Sphingobacterium detergens TaxID=1145106 RepID=UPI003AAE1F4C
MKSKKKIKTPDNADQETYISLKQFCLLFSLSYRWGCKTIIDSADYFGQACPDSIPVVFAPGTISVKGRLEHGISFTSDRRELAFGILKKDDFSGDIFYAKKINESYPDTFMVTDE